MVKFSVCLLLVRAAAAADIHAAVREDSPVKIREALAAGESIDKAGEETGGQTPLMAAVLQGKVNAVEALLAAGADASIGEGDGYTPMHGAGFQGRGEVAKLLIAHSLDPSDFHSDGQALRLLYLPTVLYLLYSTDCTTPALLTLLTMKQATPPCTARAGAASSGTPTW